MLILLQLVECFLSLQRVPLLQDAGLILPALGCTFPLSQTCFLTQHCFIASVAIPCRLERFTHPQRIINFATRHQ